MNGREAAGPSPFEARRRGEHLRVTVGYQAKMLQEAKSLDVNTSQKQKLVHRKGPLTSTTIPFDEPTIASRNSLAILVSLMNGGVDNA